MAIAHRFRFAFGFDLHGAAETGALMFFRHNVSRMSGGWTLRGGKGSSRMPSEAVALKNRLEGGQHHGLAVERPADEAAAFQGAEQGQRDLLVA